MKIPMLILGALFSTQAFAVAEYGLRFTGKSNGNIRLSITGSNICDEKETEGTPNRFKIVVHNLAKGTEQLYTSAAGQDTWNFKCKINQELPHSLLKPNMALEVLVLNKTGGRDTQIEQAFLPIPCEASKITTTQTVRLDRYTELTELTTAKVTSCAGGTVQKVEEDKSGSGTVIVDTQPQIPNCSLRITGGENVFANGNILAHCNLEGNYHLQTSLTTGDPELDRSLNCESSRYLNANEQTYLCDFLPSAYYSNRSFKLNVQLTDMETNTPVARTSKTFEKGATFKYDPDVAIQGSLVNYPERKVKAFDRGYYWEMRISAYVFDLDVDALSSELLTAELYTIKDGAEILVESKKVKNNSLMYFDLLHEYTIPKFIGKPSHSGNLDFGVSQFFIRLKDAYGEEVSKKYGLGKYKRSKSDYDSFLLPNIRDIDSPVVNVRVQ